MAITIVVETGAGLSNSNSYVTVAEADTYNENHYYGSAWAALSDENKKRAIIFATRLLDEQVDWNGTPANQQIRLFRTINHSGGLGTV